MALDDIFVDARMEGCERMTTPHGWLQRRSGWAGRRDKKLVEEGAWPERRYREGSARVWSTSLVLGSTGGEGAVQITPEPSWE